MAALSVCVAAIADMGCIGQLGRTGQPTTGRHIAIYAALIGGVCPLGFTVAHLPLVVLLWFRPCEPPVAVNAHFAVWLAGRPSGIAAILYTRSTRAALGHYEAWVVPHAACPISIYPQ